MKLRYLGLMLVFILSLVSGSFVFPKPAKAAFNANNLMSESAFDFSHSMSGAAIDNFLNSFPNSCISPASGFEAVVPVGYSPSSGFAYGDYGSAGTVISTAAQVYGINPQVLLVTLQKEQSLVSGSGSSYCNNGSEHKYAAATGYGCPDSGGTYNWSNISLYRRSGVPRTNTGTTCVNSAAKAGFSQQVIRAAWLLKFGQQRSKGNVNWAVVHGNWDNSDDPNTCYSGFMTQGSFKRCKNDASPVSYDGWTTIDGLSIHVDTGPTAALYWYTPHFHGNQNFVNLFETWFGSTQVPATCTGTETQGSVVRRFYHPATFQQFYSALDCDISFLQKLGYRNEGAVFNTTPADAEWAVPVYRYHNPQTRLHIWSTVLETPEELAAGGTGYQQEGGIVFYVVDPDMPNITPVRRFYNPQTYLHLFSPNPSQQTIDFLKQHAGYDAESIVFYTQ